jgi:hypothetical protein
VGLPSRTSLIPRRVIFRHSGMPLGVGDKEMSRFLKILVLCVFATPAMAAGIDWAKIPGKEITLFYPAQMSWELLLSNADHSGASSFRDGKNCRGCHEKEERASGQLLVGDRSVEPTPIKGKPGFVLMNVKTAFDAENIYVQVAFNPGNQPDAGMDPDFATKVAVMFDDGKVAEAGRAGCWGACHDNLTKMPSGGDAVTTKYLSRSRVKVGREGGAEIKPAAELDKIRAEGGFLEYWQAKLKPGAAPVVVDGIILEKRTEHAKPTVSAEASDVAGVWSVTFTRKLSSGGSGKDFALGKTYALGFSVHAGHTSQRFHYVSLENTLVLGRGDADFIAVKQ